jgi:hypothetical protein
VTAAAPPTPTYHTCTQPPFTFRPHPSPSVLSPCQALKTSKGDRGQRVGKMPQLAEFQFFNTKRLTELYEKEHAAEQHKGLMAQKEANLKGQVSVCVWGGIWLQELAVLGCVTDERPGCLHGATASLMPAATDAFPCLHLCCCCCCCLLSVGAACLLSVVCCCCCCL